MMAYKMLFVFIADKDAIAISDKYKHYIYDNCNLDYFLSIINKVTPTCFSLIIFVSLKIFRP